ncbi:DUF4476 domain-containing protein [Chitinophaga silvatica]|uniref:DUF4476 domain-containing protein n=1 Tax=Chitinophaga silvatica TaxID=2282649 RepID=A0A3E1Y2T0_9BACT|nr:DUF4476 domain-containing protein [Chitinophaga silvatica]RFS18936.1 DUF4476 domain-containing protein [Chitinophaga silvatica]
MRFKTLLFLCICLMVGGTLKAQRQQHYYIYIQSEKGQPFYVKQNGKVLSSTERGYIILPQLESGTANITVGFPKEESHEAQFNLKIVKTDQGYLLKRSGSSNYALYNLQTFKEVKPAGAALAAADAVESTTDTQPGVAEVKTEKVTADKDEMMSNLQKDLETTFGDKATVTGPAKKPAATKPGNSFASALDKVVVTSDDRDTGEEEINVPVAKTKDNSATRAPKGKKERDPLTDDEKELLRSVMAEESKIAAVSAAEDAVKPANSDPEEEPKKSKKHKSRAADPDFIEFQNDKQEDKTVVSTVDAAPMPEAIDESASTKSKKKKRKVFDDTEHPANVITDPSGYGVLAESDDKSSAKKKKKKSDEIEQTEDASSNTSEKKAARLVNSDCVNIMDDATFHKLLRKFVAASSDNSMIEVFRKQSRNYCLESAQIKTLGQLLTSDETRYRLLEAGYSKVYDSEKYGALESLLIDEYFKKRFKSMIRR